MFSIIDLIALSQIPSIGTNRLRLLISHFGEPSRIISASTREICAVDGFDKKLAIHIVKFIKSTEFENSKIYAEHQLSKLNKIEGEIISFWDKRYPEILKKTYDPPPILFVKGELLNNDKYSIAIVGTRTPSDYGVNIAERMSQDLSKLGITIISGLARGIDTIAHSIALKSGGRTLAVIGSGLDVLYPPENKNLAERISKHGAVISEYPMGTKPDAGNFPRRNRIISGLSLGTIIIETDLNGGAMITANTALDQNREVFAVPGNIGSKRSRGCNLLIKEGRAKLIENLDDILNELEAKLHPILKDKTSTKREVSIDMNLFEKNIYDVMSEEPCHIDTIAEKANISIPDVLVNLLSLEFKGLVKQLPGKMFIRL